MITVLTWAWVSPRSGVLIENAYPTENLSSYNFNGENFCSHRCRGGKLFMFQPRRRILANLQDVLIANWYFRRISYILICVLNVLTVRVLASLSLLNPMVVCDAVFCIYEVEWPPVKAEHVLHADSAERFNKALLRENEKDRYARTPWHH